MKNWRSSLAGLMAAATVAAVAAGCSRTGSGTSSGQAAGPAATGHKTLTLAVIPKGTVHEFWKTVQKGVFRAGKELGVEIKWDGPTNETEHDKQRSIVDNMVSLGVDGIALAPTDERALIRPVRAAVHSGVPVLIYDSNLDWDGYVSFVATDNEKGGRLAGQHLIKLLGQRGGKVVLLRYTEGSGSTLRREKGFLDVIQKAKNLKLVDAQFTDGSTAGALSTATNMLNRFVENNELQIDGMFASNLPTALGMQKALDRLRKQGVAVHARFIGFDSSDELLDGLQKGHISALVVQNPEKMGYLAVQTLVRYIRGQKVEKFIDTGVELVTKERLSEPAIRKLVGLEG